MKVLLLRPINRVSVIIPNIGLAYIAAGLRKSSHDVKILDCLPKKINYKDLEIYLRENQFDLIGIQCYSFDLRTLREHLALIKACNPKAYICVGGAHPSALPKEMLIEYSQIDFTMVGEADESFPKLATTLQNFIGADKPDRKSLEQIPNLCFRDNGEIILNKTEHIKNLDTVNPPAWDLINPNDYPVTPQGTFLKKYPYAPINITRGCPFKCTFCGGFLSTGRIVRTRSIDNIMEEVHLLYEKYGVRELHIEDDNFSYKVDTLSEFSNRILDEKLDLAWSCVNGLRIESLNKENLQLMERAGCYSMALGIESANPRILEMMKKKISIDLAEKQIELVKKYTKIQITGFFILGYPTETIEEMNNTINFALRMNIDKANFGSLMPLPGTEITNYILKNEGIEKIDWEKLTEYETCYAPKGLSRQQMRKILTKAFFKFYFRPKIIKSFIVQLRTFQQWRAIFSRILEILPFVR